MRAIGWAYVNGESARTCVVCMHVYVSVSVYMILSILSRETVDHFIATCPKYTQTREVYRSKLISLTGSNHINDRKLIQITMNADPMSKNTEKHKILACISHYIKSSYTVRLNHAKAENPS